MLKYIQEKNASLELWDGSARQFKTHQHFWSLILSDLFKMIKHVLLSSRFGSRIAVPSRGSRSEPIRNCCQQVWCQGTGFSQAAAILACLDRTSTLTLCLTCLNLPQCCPPLITPPLPTLLLGLSCHALHLPMQPSLAGRVRTGTASCATLAHKPLACPMLQCFLWPLCQHWSQLGTGTKVG